MDEAELEKLLREYAKNHAALSLLEFEDAAKRILEEMRQERDALQSVLRDTVRVLVEQDKQLWERSLTEALEQNLTGEQSVLGKRDATKRVA
jgi:hypothetical protein